MASETQNNAFLVLILITKGTYFEKANVADLGNALFQIAREIFELIFIWPENGAFFDLNIRFFILA